MLFVCLFLFTVPPLFLSLWILPPSHMPIVTVAFQTLPSRQPHTVLRLPQVRPPHRGIVFERSAFHTPWFPPPPPENPRRHHPRRTRETLHVPRLRLALPRPSYRWFRRPPRHLTARARARTARKRSTIRRGRGRRGRRRGSNSAWLIPRRCLLRTPRARWMPEWTPC